MKKACEIRISGTVQGVGYRPFIYKTAANMNIHGYVANMGGEVLVHAEGNGNELRSFSEYLEKNSPEGSKVETLTVSPAGLKDFTDFKILQSILDNNVLRSIPADISVCEDCIKDISDTSSRFFSYPFTSCTKCGPRFSIISDIPYDRENTSMDEFKMCEDCRKEYESPENRRHHAQTICCPECGPSFQLIQTKQGENCQGDGSVDILQYVNRTVPLTISLSVIFEKARMLLRQGFIIAVKGIGGYHLICDAKNDEAVRRLRERKSRKRKPFAVMFRDFESLSKNCLVDENEKKLVESRERPIVLLTQKKTSELSRLINPGLNRVGTMLPYSGIHIMLFDDEIDCILATSGNITGEPLIIDDNEALEKLNTIADYFLIHNRKIISRCDDSVMMSVGNNNLFIRRARGYAPAPVKVENNTGKSVIAFGSDLKNTFALRKDDNVYVSQFIGNLEDFKTNNSYKEEIKKYIELFSIKPQIAVCDMHPDYHSTAIARKYGLNVIQVQHHHAHIASVIAENGIEGDVIGVAFDGAGWGTDGTVWGGEFLKASLKQFERLGHIEQMPMPGADLAAKEPWRMAAVYLNKIYGDKYKKIKIPCVNEIIKNNGEVLINAVEANVNAVLTSSAGRLFDAVSAVLGICYINTYEGQAAAELEALADYEIREGYSFKINNNEILTVDFKETVESVVKDLVNGLDISIISSKFHNTVASSICDMCKRIREKTGIKKTTLSGGVFQNRLLLGKTIEMLESKGFDVYINRLVSCNDEGISLGQIAVAR